MEKKPSLQLDRKAFIRKSENIKDSYDIASKAMSSGSYGAVHFCSHKITKEKRAVKIVPKYKLTNVESFLTEIEMMKLVVFKLFHLILP